MVNARSPRMESVGWVLSRDVTGLNFWSVIPPEPEVFDPVIWRPAPTQLSSVRKITSSSKLRLTA